MIYREIQGDLFTAKDSMLVQCLSADIAAGAGIAVEFNKRFNMKNKLRTWFPNGILCADGKFEPTCVYISHEANEANVQGTFNLITKEKVWQKRSLITMELALLCLRVQVLTDGITKLAMPLIGCGIDGLSWKDVRKIIMKTFENTNVDITVYYLEKDEDIVHGKN